MSAEDRVLALLIGVPVVLIVVLVGTMALLNYLEEQPPNPVGSIPKVVFDHTDGGTLVTVKSVGERRYDAIFINYTVDGETYNSSAIDRYVLDVNVSQIEFMLNITVLLEGDHYMFNCTVEVHFVSASDVRLWIREEEDDRARLHRLPYTILMEWRDVD